MKHLKFLMPLLMLCIIFQNAAGQHFNPGPGKTISLIGQTYRSEYLDYISATGITPAGTSHYASFYLGRIEQGDDDPNAAFLDYVRENSLGEYALVALSIKDNTAAGGYGQMIEPAWPAFNSNAIWEATEDITTGQWNAQIDAFSDIMKSRGDTKFFLRIGYEVSLLLFANRSESYATDVLNKYASQGINALEHADEVVEWDLQSYRDAYNYIANRIRNVNGVTNVDFVYHPVRGYWDTYWLYPGDQFVDWFALSVFNNDVCLPFGNTTNCPNDTADGNLLSSFDFARQHGKPLMIAESAANAPANQTAAGFNEYLDRITSLIENQDIRAWAYINSNWSEDKNGDGQGDWGPEWGDSRVQKFTNTLNKWKGIMSDDRYINLGTGGSSAPSASWVNPTPNAGASLQENASITVGVEASDTDGIANVRLYINNNFVREEVSAPYEWNAAGQDDPLLRNLTLGNYTLQAIVTDNSGATTTITRTFTVSGGNSGGGDCKSSTCPASHPYLLCGQCWESAQQAESGGCTETCDNDNGGGDGGNNEDCTSDSCPVSHPYFLCGQCWASQQQAESGGCSETCSSSDDDGGNTVSMSWIAPTPANNSVLSLGTNINVALLAQGNVINGVSFLLNGQTVGVDNSAPYEWNFNGLAVGAYVVVAQAIIDGVEKSITTTFSIQNTNPGNVISGKFTPQAGKTLLAIGQDLKGLAGYRYGDIMPADYDYSLGAGEGGMPEPGAAVAYISFYLLTTPQIDGINYGATGMDNDGNFTGVDTDWGAGPLNASSTALGWNHSALILAMSITENWDQNGLQGIANGAYEANIDKLATFCKKFPDKKIYLRIGYEFDGRWNGVDVAGGLYPAGYHKTGEYKAAWRHIVEGMRTRNVTNVAYVWQSSSSPVDDVLDSYFDHGGNFEAAHENIADWYPGDEYVDWCGFSWFIAPAEADQIFGFDQVAGLPNQDDLANEVLNFARQHNKPVMVAEATPQGYDLEISEYDPTPSLVSRAATAYTYEGAKTLFTEGLQAAQSQFAPGTWFGNFSADEAWARWYAPYFNYIHQNADVIRAATYINTNWNEQTKWTYPYNEGYWGDSRVEANQTIKSLWLNEINTPFWLLGSPQIGSQLRKKGAVSVKEEPMIIYPNPAKSIINIKGVHTGNIEIYSSNGIEMYNGKENSIDVGSWPAGLYFLKSNDQYLKFIKE